MDKKDIINDCNRLAIRLARSEEYVVDDRAKLWECDDPAMTRFWIDAQIACEELRGDDIDGALEAMEC